MLVLYMRINSGYADNVAPVAPSLYSLKCTITTCEEFVKKHQITFNPKKLKLLCFNACDGVTTHINLNGRPVFIVHKVKHLGNCMSDSIHDRHILNNLFFIYLQFYKSQQQHMQKHITCKVI